MQTLTAGSRKLAQGILYLLFGSLMFTNLIARILDNNTPNSAFYVALVLALIYSFRWLRGSKVMVLHAILVGTFLLFVADPRYAFEANIWSIRDFIVPLLCFIVGASLISKHPAETANCLNVLFLPFGLYGIAQEILFYFGGLEGMLSWDSELVKRALASAETTNVILGSLVRFFGTMNAFVEYQVCSIVIGSFLLFNLSRLRFRVLGIVNICIMLTFAVLSLERAPMAMLIILFLVWKWTWMWKRLGWILPVGLLIALTTAGALAEFHQTLRANDLVGEQYQRLINVLTLNLKQDEAINEREDTEWRIALELAGEHFFGIGPGRVAPGAQEYGGYVPPHNNFLALYLGYSGFGLIAFLVFLGMIVRSAWGLEESQKWFTIGLISAYCAMAMFNMPFVGKQGIVFFLITGALVNSRRPVRRMAVRERYTGPLSELGEDKGVAVPSGAVS